MFKLLKKLSKFIFSRVVIVGSLILVQAVILVLGIWALGEKSIYLNAFFLLLSISITIYLLNKNDNPAYKLAWIIPILLFPIFGGLFYLIFGNVRISKRLVKNSTEIYEATTPLLKQDPAIPAEIATMDETIAKQSHYITNSSTFPIYKNTTTKFLSPGEVKFQYMVEELQKAKHFIFLEYFIIQEGVMWNTVLDILEEKVKEGVEVRLMYDDLGCVGTLPYRYFERMEKAGIQCLAFNPFVPFLSVKMNNRDHRKICVIDGYVGFTGGINLADEYINEFEKHGHWKDSSILLKGEAVWNLTIMFLQLWNFSRPTDTDFERFRPHVGHPEAFENDGYVQPFGDTPLDGEIVSENVYLNIINNANRYVYINTPYLIVDNEMVSALMLAAKNGVDVRIVTPHKADKWYVHLVTRSYYQQLVEAGVKIYEYTPGFIHSKNFVSDDKVGVVGTANLDYRSLYLHFECSAWLYQSEALMELKADFLKMLDICTPITLEDTKNVKWYTRLLRSILRAFAPLM